MKPYPAYKDSGVEWIGEIPMHWNLKKLKYDVFFQEGPGIMAVDFLASGIPLIRISGMKGDYVSFEGCNYLSPEKVESKWKHFRLEKGEILISCSASTDLVCEVDESTEGAIPYTGLIRLSSKTKNVVNNYIKWFVRTDTYKTQIKLLQSGSTIQHYGPTHLSSMLAVIPPPEEQTAIANFLDHKTTQIDTAIEKHRRLIELLQEHRAALINEAVTKGINPNAPMKDSGIEWIGEVPEHWERKKVKYVCRIIDCKHITPKYVEKGIPVVSTGNVKPEEITTDSVRMVSQHDYELLTEGGRKPKKFDIIYSRNATVGAAALVKLDTQFCLGQDVCIIRSSLNQQFLEKLLNSKFITNQLESELVGSTFRRINIGQVKEFFILVPPTNEQIQIVDYIETETTHIDEEITLAQQEIDLLEEYRQALIAEAVTGKIDVRDYPLED